MEIIKDIGTVIGLILSAITLITLCCKPIRKRFVSWIRHTSKTDETVQWMQEFKEMLQNHIALDEKKQAQMDLISAAMLDLLRDDITRIYFQYIGKKELPAYEKQNLATLFERYTKMGGNAYIHNVYEELMELPLSEVK